MFTCGITLPPNVSQSAIEWIYIHIPGLEINANQIKINVYNYYTFTEDSFPNKGVH